MKKKFSLIIIILISMFAFNMSAKASYSCKADTNECEIKPGGGQGVFSNCSKVSGNITVRYDADAKKCYVKSNAISQSGFRGVIHLESNGGAYGGVGSWDSDVEFTSAGGNTEKGENEKVASGTFNPDGSWTELSGQVTGAITSCTVESGSARVEFKNGSCKISSTSSGNVVLKIVHTAAGAVWTTRLTVNYGTAAGGGPDTSSDSSSSSSTPVSTSDDLDFLNICDENDSPQVLATFRLIGIFITIAKIVAPIIIVIMGLFDIAKAVTDGKEDAIVKQGIALIKRFIAGLLIFFVPSIILSIYDFIDGWDEVRSEHEKCVQCLLGDSSCPNVGFNGNVSGGSSKNNGHNGMPSDIEQKLYGN